MNKNILIALFIGICLVLTFPLTAPAKAITLSLADQNSEVGWGPVHAVQPWAKQVEQATKGKVKIRIYPSQTL
ncbi:MAG: hypothetical protein JSW15_07675, partial [Deltaproteobacteria bacterium]